MVLLYGSYLYLTLKLIIPITEGNPQMYKLPAIYCSICTFISFIKDYETWGHPSLNIFTFVFKAINKLSHIYFNNYLTPYLLFSAMVLLYGSYLYLTLKLIIPITEGNPQMYKLPAIYCSIYTFISFIKDYETWGHPSLNIFTFVFKAINKLSHIYFNNYLTPCSSVIRFGTR